MYEMPTSCSTTRKSFNCYNPAKTLFYAAVSLPVHALWEYLNKLVVLPQFIFKCKAGSNYEYKYLSLA